MSPRSDSAASHATAAADKREAHWKQAPPSRRPRVRPHKRDEVITSDTGRAARQRDGDEDSVFSETGPRSGRAICMSTPAEAEDGELLTSHWATRSDTETLIMASPFCSASV